MEAEQAIQKASTEGKIFVSPISAWEIGNVVSLNRLRLKMHPIAYFNEFVSRSNATVSDMPPDLLIASNFLPGPIHGDPMDRILIETARQNKLTLVTRDKAILAYGAEGFVQTLAC